MISCLLREMITSYMINDHANASSLGCTCTCVQCSRLTEKYGKAEASCNATPLNKQAATQMARVPGVGHCANFCVKIFVHKCVEIFLHRCLKMARYKMYVCNYNPKDNTRIVKIFCEFISVEQTMFLIISCYKDLPSPPQIAVFKKVPTSQTLDLFLQTL